MQNALENRPNLNLSLRIAALFIIAGVVLRLLPHPWDFTPTRALALFAGAYLSTRLGTVVVLLVLFLSDIALGLHATMPFTWASFLIVMALGRPLGSGFSAPKLLARTLAGSVVFFVVTNLGVFLLQSLYPKSLAGLIDCYVMAIPFFRNSLVGDVVYAFGLFGAYHLVMSRLAAPASSKNKPLESRP